MAKMNVRHIQKHDTEENWLKAKNFIPLAGEIILYDPDNTHDYTRQKIGDGIHNVNDLKFITNVSNWEDLENKPTKLSDFENDKGFIEQ